MACVLLAGPGQSCVFLPTLLPVHVSSVISFLGCAAHSDSHSCLFLVAHGPWISKQNYLPALHPNGLLCSVIAPQEDIGQGSPWASLSGPCKLQVFYPVVNIPASAILCGHPRCHMVFSFCLNYLPGNLLSLVSFLP